MKEESQNSRRTFLKKVSIGGLTVSALPSSLFNPDSSQVNKGLIEKNRVDPAKRKYNAPYSGDNLNRVAFPIGGMGAGMFCLEGTGRISHMSVRHRPEMFHEPNMFAAITVKGLEKNAKVLEGPIPKWKLFGQRGAGNGAHGANHGLPRFEQGEFTARFPFAFIDLKDGDLPLDVLITGWSPFVPTDEDNSSLPVGSLEYKFVNKGDSEVDAVFSYNSWNFLLQDGQMGAIKSIDNGFVLVQEGTEEKPHLQSSFAIFTDQSPTVVDHCWFRGGWFDPLTMVWDTIKECKVKQNDPVDHGAPGASLFVPFKLKAGETKTIRVMMSWYMPKSDLKAGEIGIDDCATSSNCCATPVSFGLDEKNRTQSAPNYKPWYSSKFDSINEVAEYWKTNYNSLYTNSCLFKDAFYASTLPAEVMEAVAANLTILKSPTVMRQFDGRLWNWEGSSDDWGCCHGSCTHVWNYAQAIPHLFPRLERSLRHAEFCENQNREGHQAFRTNLPISPTKHDFHAAADGQLGGIMKVYREWRISGSKEWLEKMYPLVEAGLNYCIHTWDPKRKGILEEPHHNTYDIEFWGPNGMSTSFYLGALLAISKMGEFLKKDISEYSNLYFKGKEYMETVLYNGEYFIQNIQWTGLQAPNPVEAQSFHTQYSEEALAILQKEGPKYQYGQGCLSDGILGGWIANMCGLEDPVDPEMIKSHLMAVHKYNLKDDLSDHVNPQRPGYALGNEGGLLLCSWPKGGKLSLPFVYSNEVWTGIEYQVASHLMLMGQVQEALDIVRACRDRYDGQIRNPFNEYECGNWYGRAMASYGMIEGLTGVRYDGVDKTLYCDSKIGDFVSFLSTEKGFGTVIFKNGKPTLKVAVGEIPIKRVFVQGKQVNIGKADYYG